MSLGAKPIKRHLGLASDVLAIACDERELACLSRGVPLFDPPGHGICGMRLAPSGGMLRPLRFLVLILQSSDPWVSLVRNAVPWKSPPQVNPTGPPRLPWCCCLLVLRDDNLTFTPSLDCGSLRGCWAKAADLQAGSCRPGLRVSWSTRILTSHADGGQAGRLSTRARDSRTRGVLGPHPVTPGPLPQRPTPLLSQYQP